MIALQINILQKINELSLKNAKYEINEQNKRLKIIVNKMKLLLFIFVTSIQKFF